MIGLTDPELQVMIIVPCDEDLYSPLVVLLVNLTGAERHTTMG